jgi:hypothetical protein
VYFVNPEACKCDLIFGFRVQKGDRSVQEVDGENEPVHQRKSLASGLVADFQVLLKFS